MTTKNQYGSLAYVPYYYLPSNDKTSVAKADMSAGQIAIIENTLFSSNEALMNEQLDYLSNLDNTNQIKDNLLQNPLAQVYNLSISNGTQKMTNRISLIYENNKDNYKGDVKSKYKFNYNGSYAFNRHIKLNIIANFNYVDNQYKGLGSQIYSGYSPYTYAILKAPYQMLLNEDGTLARWSNGTWTHYTASYGGGTEIYQPNFDRYVDKSLYAYDDWSYNPIEELNHTDFRQKTIHARLNAGLDVNIIKGLNYHIQGLYEIYRDDFKELYDEQSHEVRFTVNQTSGGTYADAVAGNVVQTLPCGSIVDEAKREVHAWNVRNQIDFDKEFGQHHLVALLGTEISKKETDIIDQPTRYGYDETRGTTSIFPCGLGNTLGNYLYNSLYYSWSGFPANIKSPYPNNTDATLISDYRGYNVLPATGYQNEIYFSLFGNLSYTYKDKYSITFSARTDASNFISDKAKYRYSPFWSVGGKWAIFRENFMKEFHWIDYLTLRATYGCNGIPNKNSYAKTVLSIDTQANSETGINHSSIFRGYANPDLHWEKVSQFNLGIDYSFMEGKLFGSLDIYKKNSTDLITSVVLPSYSGTSQASLNAVSMKNNGFELSVGTSLPIIKNAISWNGNLSFSYNDNKVTKTMSEPRYLTAMLGSYRYECFEGDNSSVMYTLKYGGMNENNEPMICDKEGNKYLLSDIYTLSGDIKNYLFKAGNSTPPFNASFNSSFRIYSFALSFLMTGSFGNKLLAPSYSFSMPSTNQSIDKEILAAKTVDPSQNIPLLMDQYYPYLTNSVNSWSRYFSSNVLNGSVIRLNEVNLSYNVPRVITDKLHISLLKVYIQANNLANIYFNDRGLDPIYQYSRPRQSYTLGLCLNF